MNLPVDTPAVDEAGILWTPSALAEIGTPSRNADTVNRLVNLIERQASRLGIEIERRPGMTGFGDVLVLRTLEAAGGHAPPILILDHVPRE